MQVVVYQMKNGTPACVWPHPGEQGPPWVSARACGEGILHSGDSFTPRCFQEHRAQVRSDTVRLSVITCVMGAPLARGLYMHVCFCHLLICSSEIKKYLLGSFFFF